MIEARSQGCKGGPGLLCLARISRVRNDAGDHRGGMTFLFWLRRGGLLIDRKLARCNNVALKEKVEEGPVKRDRGQPPDVVPTRRARRGDDVVRQTAASSLSSSCSMTLRR